MDEQAQLPVGTCANYLPSRVTLLSGMAEQIFVLIGPDPARLQKLAKLPASEAFPEYVGYVVERLLAKPQLARALIELRLEASRSPEVAEALGSFLRAGLDDDLAFHTGRGLPGGRDLIVLTHHVVNGLVLDQLTLPLDPTIDAVALAKRAAKLLAS